jgi:hypothetical protein
MIMKSRLLPVLALSLNGSLCGCSTTSGDSLATRPAGAADDGLQMSLSILPSGSRTGPALEVAFQNVGEQDFCLNLGVMLANGKVQLPTEIHLTLADGSGKSRELDFALPGVAGRLDDYEVPLRAGSSYTLKLQLDQFISPATGEFEPARVPGRHEISAWFQGKGTDGYLMPDVKLMNFWKGRVQSNVILIEK